MAVDVECKCTESIGPRVAAADDVECKCTTLSAPRAAADDDEDEGEEVVGLVAWDGAPGPPKRTLLGGAFVSPMTRQKCAANLDEDGRGF